MWNMEAPWYEIVIRAAVIFVAVMVIMRIWGKKHFSEINPFDFILLLIISESLQNALVDDDKSIPAGILSFGTLVLLNVICNRIGYFSRTMEKIIDGQPKVLIKNGELDHGVMLRECLSMQEVHSALRAQGVLEPCEVQWAIIETNGKISVIKKEEKSN